MRSTCTHLHVQDAIRLPEADPPSAEYKRDIIEGGIWPHVILLLVLVVLLARTNLIHHSRIVSGSGDGWQLCRSEEGGGVHAPPSTTPLAAQLRLGTWYLLLTAGIVARHHIRSLDAFEPDV
jgi:hypothetical protein